MATKNSPSKSKKNRNVGANRSANRGKEPQATSRTPSTLATRCSWIGFIAVLLACVTWVMVHAFLVDAVTVRFCNAMDKDIPKEKRLPLFLSEIAFDGYAWNRNAEHLGENGEWRVRHTDLDNAPNGREVHWNSAFAWYLRGLGEIYKASTGDSLRNSIFRMSIWANPILLVIALGIFTTLSARRFGPLCGTVMAIGMVATPTFYEGFLPAYPDHHGLIAFTILGTLFGIAWAGAGWIRTENEQDFVTTSSLKQARHGMIFSGICASAGLLCSAFSLVVVAIGVGIGAIASVAIFSRKMARHGNYKYHPELWMTWAVVTAAGSVFFYVLEYFPSNMGMRLEINHPLYALAWFGGGWAISEITAWLCLPIRSPKNFPWRNVALSAALCAILPGFILIGGQRFYILLDPFQMFLSANIVETLSLFKRIAIGSMSWEGAFGWFPLFLLAIVILLPLRRVGLGSKATLIFLAIPILLITGLMIYQVRWGMLNGPLYIALAGIVVPQVWKLVPRSTWTRGIAALLFLGFAYLFVEPAFKNAFYVPWMQFKSDKDLTPSPGQAMALLHRQMARAILDSAGGQPVVLLSSPNSSIILAALGGFHTIGTLYWENNDGPKIAAKILNAQSNEETLSLLKEHGITHVALMTWENFIEPYFRALYPKPVEGKSVENSFGVRALFNRQIPPWTRPLIFPPNDLTKGLHQQVLLLQIVPDQNLNEAKFHLGRFVRFVEDNPVQAEMTFKEILENAPESNLVRIELIDLYIAQHRYEEAVNQMQKAMTAVAPEVRDKFCTQLAGTLVTAKQWNPLAKLLHWEANFPDATPETLQNTAWLLATMPDPTARDPKLALAYCDRLEKLPHNAATLSLIRAAALAAAGDFQQAQAALPDTADQQTQEKAGAMRASFKSGQVWTEGR